MISPKFYYLISIMRKCSHYCSLIVDPTLASSRTRNYLTYRHSQPMFRTALKSVALPAMVRAYSSARSARSTRNAKIIIGASLVTTSVALLPFTVVKNDESTSEKSKPEKSTGNDNDDSVFYGKKDQPNKKVDKKQPETIVDPAGEKTMKTDRPRNPNAIEGKKAEINSDAAANVSGKSGKSKSTVSETGTVKDQKLEDSESSNEPEGNGEEAGEQSAAFNPETGEINWDCPCLGGMAHGPCGEEFKAAFSCFVYSETEPKGIDCIQAFEDMRTCFSRHPEHYKEELYEDDDKTSSESENFDDTTVDIPKVA